MPWKAVDMKTLRKEFVDLAKQEGANISQLCCRFGISRKTGYKILARAEQEGDAGLVDRSRRPVDSPTRTSSLIETRVIELRHQHPAWGAIKIGQRLRDLGHEAIPAPSTINRILSRNGLIDEHSGSNSTAFHRFEHPHPNDLWQMDFKGYFETGAATCHPLTIIDDHSRYNIVLKACTRPQGEQVQAALEDVFRRYGMPIRINTDNGSPWGSPSQTDHGITKLTIWLIQLGIRISHSRPAHPQTNGKNERFHRSLKLEVLRGRHFTDLAQTQEAFDAWRHVYNHERPHAALGLKTPATRYQISRIAYPDQLPEIEYPSGDLVVEVGWNGKIVIQGRKFKVSSALHRHRIGIRPQPNQDGQFELYFAHHRFGKIDLHQYDVRD